MPEFQTFAESRREGIRFDASGPHATRRGTVVASSGHDVAAVLQSNSIRFGAQYIDEQGGTPDGGLLCIAIAITPTPGAATGGQGLYSWTAEYGYLSRSLAMAHPTPAPEVDGKARVRVDYSVVQTPVDLDADGNAITNSSGEPFDNPPSVPIVEQRIIATWIRTFSSFQAAHDYRRPYPGKINSAMFLGAQPHELFCEGITMQEASLPGGNPIGSAWQFEGAWLYKERFTVPGGRANVGPHWHPGTAIGDRVVAGWSYTVNDVGRRILTYQTGGGVKLREVRENDVDPNSELVREPVSLRRVAGPAGTINTTWDTAPPNVRSFRLLRAVDFNALELELE